MSVCHHRMVTLSSKDGDVHRRIVDEDGSRGSSVDHHPYEIPPASHIHFASAHTVSQFLAQSS